MKQPNILFAFADDWGRYASCYGDTKEAGINSLINTVNIDRIAREGVRFTNAFVTAPSCTPCRSSVLSGQYFWRTGLGSILIGAVWDESIPTYPLILEEQGYFIGHTYKVWSPGKNPDAPYGAERTAYSSPQMKTGRFGRFSQEVTKMVYNGADKEKAKEEIFDETRHFFRQFLNDRPDDKPFCYWWGPTNTHREWERGSGKALWGIEPENLKGKLPDFLPDVPEIREDVADYLGECLAVDGGLGVLLEVLEEKGELDNTLIVVSGDHGIPGLPRGKCNLYDMGSEVPLLVRWPESIKAGRVVTDFVNMMEMAPTFLEAAGVDKPSSMHARSIWPLLVSSDEGRIEEERDFVVIGRERHVHNARKEFLPYPQRAVRTDEWLYIRNYEPGRWPMGDPRGLDDYAAIAPSHDELVHNTRCCYADLDASPTKAWMIENRAREELKDQYELGFGKRPAEELYNIKDDPHNMNNLAEDPSLKEIKRALANRLRDELVKFDDPRETENPCRFEFPPYAGDVDWWP